MTPSQPGAPAAPQAPARPLSREAREIADGIDAANRTAEAATQGAEEAARRQAARDAAPDDGRAALADAPQASSPGVVRNGEGQIVVTGRDGRTVVIDPKAGLDEDAVQELVRTTLAPPPGRRGSDTSGTDVAIVSIIFPCIIVIMLIVWRIVATAKRAAPGGAAAAGPGPEVAARLARIEQAIEAVAIEVERISESERYSARLLTERLAEPARAPAAPLAPPLAPPLATAPVPSRSDAAG